MSISATTLVGAIDAVQTRFSVASTGSITAPNFQTGSGITYLMIGNEMMEVFAVPQSGVVDVIRGWNSTIASAHGATEPVLVGTPTDFATFQPTQGSSVQALNRYDGISAPIASAATIAAPGKIFHVTGGTAINIITPPTNFVEGEIKIIFDSACTWTSSAVANGIAASGTSTTALSTVTFTYDAATALWYPSRLA